MRRDNSGESGWWDFIMNEKIERNPQGGGSLGSSNGSSFSFRDTPSQNPVGSPVPRSDSWVENPESHLNPSSPPPKDSKNTHTATSTNPKLLSTTSLKPNYKIGDSDRSETSEEDGEGLEFHRDQNLNLKVDGKIEDLSLLKRGF